MPDDETTTTTVEEVDKDQVQTDPEEIDIEQDISELIDWEGSLYNRLNAGYINSAEELSAYINEIAETGWGTEYNTPSNASINNTMSNTMNGIFGIPYQFTTTVDPIADGFDNVGRKYVEKILSVMPVLFLTPGEPVFMSDYGKDAKNTVAKKFFEFGSDNNESGAFEELGDGRYYSLSGNFTEYQRYANIALRALAVFMNIGDVRIPTPESGNVRLREIRVEQLLNKNFQKMFGTNLVVPFYLDAETAVTEQFGNSTTESILSQAANSMSPTAREIQFMLGSRDLGGIGGAVKDAVTGLGSNIIDAAAELLGGAASAFVGKGLVSQLSSELTTIVSGGKIVFPKIWSESSYSRSYSVSLKLRSPDPDPVSIFLNIYVPIILLVSMAAPRQLGNSANSYESPFLVRATYKSIFNCELGIISSLQISKGGEDMWNVMGMPVTADVTVEIEDLYSSMSISKSTGILNNTAQMDYLALMAGVDMNDMDIMRMIKLGTMVYLNKPRDFVLDGWSSIKQTLNRTANRILSAGPSIIDTRFSS